MSGSQLTIVADAIFGYVAGIDAFPRGEAAAPPMQPVITP
jgi:hypothetical protein